MWVILAGQNWEAGWEGQRSGHLADNPNIFKVSELMSWEEEEEIIFILKINFSSEFLLPIL
jgi:hypothetical protein